MADDKETTTTTTVADDTTTTTVVEKQGEQVIDKSADADVLGADPTPAESAENQAKNVEDAKADGLRNHAAEHKDD